VAAGTDCSNFIFFGDDLIRAGSWIGIIRKFDADEEMI
jgi:hypothetical protein